ncbi:Terpenoid cyclases/protein prenyltransferase alpha-alpha toroid [Arabidopsis thaliana x Arabidopsis arenosa]|uniref:Ribophorin II n=1 Tax=Arabidopsis thaliana x Arabidopsis arenosa TaxID=1240361 RepID=A0A8T1Y8U2_9BRAS|nr:Terpenoid cyclases/protein prenyltransferase alpha-alpha toroid [Arabidopsis thaliana x Arabidopsis arenosa]
MRLRFLSRFQNLTDPRLSMSSYHSKSLEEAYEALKTLEILGIDKKSDLSSATCENVVKVLASPSSALKDVFYALRVNGILKCKSGEDVPKDIVSKLQADAKDAKLLLDFYYSVRGLVLVKEQFSGTDLSLADAEAIFRSIKALSQSDGRWRYSSNNPESSTFGAGLAFETLAGVISLAPSGIDQSMIQTLKTGILKLFDRIQKYDDGTFYFDDSEGSISTTASVIRGLMSFSASESTGLNLPGDKIVGLAKFFLGVGIPGDAKDFFNQIDALACLEDNRFSVPLILSLPSTVISLTKKELLKVKVSTVLGSKAPALSVKVAEALNSKGSSVINNQALSLTLTVQRTSWTPFPRTLMLGSIHLYLRFCLMSRQMKKLTDVGSVESQKKLDLTKDEAVSLSANHLQKLRLSFQLTTPLGLVFKPHQAFLKLKHESQVEHIFLVKTSGKKAELVLDFLGLVEKLYYLSGKYEIQLTIGDAAMENSLLTNIGYIELDLPERPEKAPLPPLQPTDPYSRYGPKAEISHIFCVPEKLPAKKVSLVFLGLIVLPFIGFLIGLTRLGANIKSFPSSIGAATSALLFHGGIGAVLLLYVLFWLKAIGSVHDTKGTFFVGSVSVVRWTQHTLSPRSSIEQVEICLKNVFNYADTVGSEHKELPIIDWSCNIRSTIPRRHRNCSASLRAILVEDKFSKPVLELQRGRSGEQDLFSDSSGVVSPSRCNCGSVFGGIGAPCSCEFGLRTPMGSRRSLLSAQPPIQPLRLRRKSRGGLVLELQRGRSGEQDLFSDSSVVVSPSRCNCGSVFGGIGAPCSCELGLRTPMGSRRSLLSAQPPIQPLRLRRKSRGGIADTVGSEHKELPIIDWSCNIRSTIPQRHRNCSASLRAILVEGKFSKPLDLFTTLKALSLLGVFLLFVGHSTLSHLAAASNKLKSA